MCVVCLRPHLAAESKSSVRCRYLQALIFREVQLIADTMAFLSVLKLGQKLLPFRRYDVQSSLYLIDLMLTKYGRGLANFLSKLRNFEKHLFGTNISFAAMSDLPTPNLGFLVQSSWHSFKILGIQTPSVYIFSTSQLTTQIPNIYSVTFSYFVYKLNFPQKCLLFQEKQITYWVVSLYLLC